MGLTQAFGRLDGFLVESGDVEAAAAKLARLAEDAGLRHTLGEQGKAHVLERYSVARLVDDVDRLYRSLLAATGYAASSSATTVR